MSGDPRCYTLAQVLEKLHMARGTFEDLRRKGQLPFLDELRPRLGRYVRYRAEPIDRYLAGLWTGPRLLTKARR